MKMFKILILTFFLFMIGCSSQTDTYQSLSEEILDVFEEIALIIDNVTDDISASESIQSLNELDEKMNNLTERMKKLGDLDKNASEFLKNSNYEDRFKNVLSNLFESTISISDKPYGKDIMDTLTGILNPNN